MIADVDGRDPDARSFVYSEVEKKKTELVTGVFGGRERTASKKPALRELRVCRSRMVIWRFWSLFWLILQTGLAESC